MLILFLIVLIFSNKALHLILSEVRISLNSNYLKRRNTLQVLEEYCLQIFVLCISINENYQSRTRIYFQFSLISKLCFVQYDMGLTLAGLDPG